MTTKISDFEKTPQKENTIPVISKTAPIINTGNKPKLDTVCQYLPNWVSYSVVFSKLMLAIKDENNNINTPVISCYYFFRMIPPRIFCLMF